MNLTGGRTKDGGSIVGASVFYSNPPEVEDNKNTKDEIDKLDQQLKVKILVKSRFLESNQIKIKK